MNGDLLQKILGLLKSGMLPTVAACVGFLFHQAVASNEQQHELQDHTTQIQKLIQGQEATHTDLNGVSVTIARIEGKLDVLNQKIDDDRNRPAPVTRHQ
jgi:hypothetical protein